MTTSSRDSLYFTAPRQVAVVHEPLDAVGADELLVRTVVSAISPGTELLAYRGEIPDGMPLDATIAGLAADVAFPLKYGYSTVGRVMHVGADVSPDWLDTMVFSFHPHESYFLAREHELMRVPDQLSAEYAAFYPNVESAVTLVMDGRPLIGERVAVFGQGVVGLLTTAVLAKFPLSGLVALDPHPLRRRMSTALGAHEAADPGAPLATEDGSFDLTYELSGSPAALDQAIAVTGFHGRVVIGSWYGDRRAQLDLGGSFHRSRMQLRSSQVSTIDPALTGRWSMERRSRAAWRMLKDLKPARLVTHRFAFAAAADAYELLDRHPDQAIQVLLTYDA